MTTHPSANARCTGASIDRPTAPPATDVDPGAALQSAPLSIHVGDAKERTMRANRRLSRPGQPPDGGA